MSPRLLHLLTVGENRRRLRGGFLWLTPTSHEDRDDLQRANERGYGARAVAEHYLRSGY